MSKWFQYFKGLFLGTMNVYTTYNRLARSLLKTLFLHFFFQTKHKHKIDLMSNQYILNNEIISANGHQVDRNRWKPRYFQRFLSVQLVPTLL